MTPSATNTTSKMLVQQKKMARIPRTNAAIALPLPVRGWGYWYA